MYTLSNTTYQSSHFVYLYSMHNITNLWKLELSWSSKLRDNSGRKTPLSHEVLCLQTIDFDTSIFKL